MLKRLAHVCLGTTNLSRKVSFYQTMFDCEIVHEFVNPAGERYGVFLYCGEGTFLEFFNELTPPHDGGLFRHLCFELDDIEKMAKKFRAIGQNIEIGRGRTDGTLQFFARDPDEIMLEFHQYDSKSVLYTYATKIEAGRH